MDFLVHTVKLKPIIKVEISGKLVTSVISDVVFASVHSEKIRLKNLIMIIIIIRPYLIDYMFHGSPSTNFDQGGRPKKKKSMNIIKKNFLNFFLKFFYSQE